MFTGIVQTRGIVRQIDCRGKMLALKIEAPAVMARLVVGASVAVNGACLTVTRRDDRVFTADVMPESVRRTNLGQLRLGQAVNIEPALTLQTGLDGHLVLGHVDYCGTVMRLQRDQTALRLWVSLPAAQRYQVVEKGSVTIEGVSLTVVAVSATAFEVDLIPHSQGVTTLGHLVVGRPVNVETDILGKYVAQLVRKGSWHRG